MMSTDAQCVLLAISFVSIHLFCNTLQNNLFAYQLVLLLSIRFFLFIYFDFFFTSFPSGWVQ